MANDVQIVSAAPQVYVRYLVRTNSQNVNANTSNITVDCYALVRNGSRTGGWDWRAEINGTTSGSKSVSNVTGDIYMGSRTVNVSHDANGNLTIYVAAWLDVYFGSGTASQNYTPARIALAPAIAGTTVDNIKPVAARLGAELTNYGHGTSGYLEMFYRLQGSGTWISAGQQSDTAGYNYWTVTGLKPNKTYEYYVKAWNNNSDVSNSSTQTFKTKGTAGLAPLMLALLQG